MPVPEILAAVVVTSTSYFILGGKRKAAAETATIEGDAVLKFIEAAERLQGRIEQLEDDVVLLKGQLAGNLREISELRAERDGARDEIARLTSEVQQLRKEVEQYERNRSVTDDQINELRTRLAEVTAQRDHLARQIEAFRASFSPDGVS